jgi:UDP-N-acetylglucosamine 2-epimerase (non-hydrolysing)
MTAPVAVVFGTRPEAIKMAPLVAELRRRGRPVSVVVTAQHRSLLDGALRTFGLIPDVDLDLMQTGQSLTELGGRALAALGRAFETVEPAAVLVHGDTTTTLAASIAAFYRGIPVGHVEAGLRTGDLRQPFPEEGNRKLVAAIADWHFCPTDSARRNLLAEGVKDEAISVTGNTVVDALLGALPHARRGGRPAGVPAFDGRLLLVTAHRRESFGDGLTSLCRALLDLVDRFPDLHIVYPVHPNPCVSGPVRALLVHDRVHLLDPQEYLPFLWLLDRADVVLTDSGGLQEEAPSLGKPVLVARDVTERPEAVEAGTVRLVGTDRARVVSEVSRLLDDPAAYGAMARAVNPYGDGRACGRIADVLERRLG